MLEVTETAIVADVAEAAATLRRVRELGAHFALDDFGTGHSSLTLLRNLPLQSVKIDRSLIRKVASEAQDAVLVQLVVDAAHTLGLRVCAEGVEEVDQAQQLMSLGCDTGQGWLFGKPAPPADEPVRALDDEGPAWLARHHVRAGRAHRERRPRRGGGPAPPGHLRRRPPAAGCSAGCRRR